MDVNVSKSKLKGKLEIPPSKSHSMRAILFGSLARGETVVKKVLLSPDSEAMILACRMLGAVIEKVDRDVFKIQGFDAKPKVPDNVIDAQNSGQVLRFVAAICALTDGYSIITGDHSIRTNRPIKPLLEGLSKLGAFAVSSKQDGYAPIVIKGPIHAGKTSLEGRDSQPVTALLIVSSFLKGKTTIHVKNPQETPWIDLTLSWLDRMGLKVTHEKYKDYVVYGNGKIEGFEYVVPGDLSSLSFPLIAALITQSEITITNVDMNDMQGDKKIVELVQKMGAQIEIHEKKRELRVKKSPKLKGIEIDMNDLIDAVPILSVLGCFINGTLRLKNASIARKKECDRLSCTKKELEKMGASIEEKEDELIIHPRKLKGHTVLSHKDHRMAMALCVAGMAAEGKTVVQGIECMKKSYPAFIEHMKELGADIR